jgi:chromate transporter
MSDVNPKLKTDQPSNNTPLLELAGLFLKLGVIGFGGPAAHIAMMEHEVVRRRKWLTRERFLDLLGATNLIPGPNSTEMAIHIGQVRAGFPGLIVAGACFILPAMAIVMGCAWVYVKFGSLPKVGGILYAVKPIVIAIVIQALWGLGKTAIRTTPLAIICVVSIGATFLGINELLVLVLAGLVAALAKDSRPGKAFARAFGILIAAPSRTLKAAIYAQQLSPIAVATLAAPFTLGTMFLFFLKVGAILYGSGYVLLAFLRADLVERWHWLTESQLLDAIAVGQITPGPVFTTATFIGYILGGPTGGVLATVGIFLPAFCFVALSGPLVPRIRKSRTAAAFLDGVNVASLALMGVVTFSLPMRVWWIGSP